MSRSSIKKVSTSFGAALSNAIYRFGKQSRRDSTGMNSPAITSDSSSPSSSSSSILLLRNNALVKTGGYRLETGLYFRKNFRTVIRVSHPCNSGGGQKMEKNLYVYQWFALLKKEREAVRAIWTLLEKGRRGEEEEENVTNCSQYVYLGKYNLKADSRDRVVYFVCAKTGETKLILTEQFWRELERLYESVSLQLEILQKYHNYAAYLYSRYVNHFSKLPEESCNWETLEKCNLNALGRIPYFRMTYTNRDTHVCRLLHSEMKHYCAEEILKAATFVRNSYSSSWIQSNHMLVTL